MAQDTRGVTWEALEHTHAEKKSDWFWALGIVTLGAALASILLGNTLLGIVIIISGITMGLLAAREPKVISYAVTTRGLRIDDVLFPYSTLHSFFLNDEEPTGPILLVRSEKMFMPLIIMPLPEEFIEEIEDIIESRLPEEHLEEPFINKLLEFFGF